MPLQQASLGVIQAENPAFGVPLLSGGLTAARNSSFVSISDFSPRRPRPRSLLVDRSTGRRFQVGGLRRGRRRRKRLQQRLPTLPVRGHVLARPAKNLGRHEAHAVGHASNDSHLTTEANAGSRSAQSGFSSHVRRGLFREYELASEAHAIVLTLDSWMQMAPSLRTEALTRASTLADTDGNVTQKDRHPVIFCSIQYLADMLVVSTEDDLLNASAQSATPEHSGWALREVRREGRQPEERKSDVRLQPAVALVDEDPGTLECEKLTKPMSSRNNIERLTSRVALRIRH